MEIIIGERQSGKTSQLIRLCAETGGHIVCRDMAKDSIMKQAEEMGLDIHYPISYTNFIEKTYCERDIEKIYIDDVDALLARMVKAPGMTVVAATVDYCDLTNMGTSLLDEENQFKEPTKPSELLKPTKKSFFKKILDSLFVNNYEDPARFEPMLTPLFLGPKPRPTYIFQFTHFLKPVQAQKVRDEIKRQLDEELLILDPIVSFVDRKIEICGHEVTLKYVGDKDCLKEGDSITKLSKWYDMVNQGDDYSTYTRDTWIIPDEGSEIWCTGWSRGQTIKPYGDGCHIIVGLTVYHCDEFMEKLLIQELGCQRWGIEGVQPIREQLVNGCWTRVEFT